MKDIEQKEVFIGPIETQSENVSENITVEMKDWLFNAGLVGFVNIMKHSGDKVVLKGCSVEFDTEVLTNFEEKYFNYFIDTYERKLSWYKVVSVRNFLDRHISENFINFDDKCLEHLNEYIGSSSKSGSLKYLLNSNSYKSAYELIGYNFDVLAIEKKIQPVKIKKGEDITKRMSEIIDNMVNIKVITDYFLSQKSKKYLCGKNVIYTIIKNAWSGVSFLNSQVKEKDFYLDFKKYFIEEVTNYSKENKAKFKYMCFSCSSKIKNLDNDLSFMNITGFDTGRKPSHVWNFVNDVAICPICKLIYSCVPAGFSYVYSHGIYINENHSIENALRINNRIKSEVLNDEKMNKNTTYKALITALKESINQSAKYELADIQVVRYENDDGKEKYKFNILSKKMLDVLHESEEHLNGLLNAGYNEIKTYFNIYEDVMKLILNNENLFLLIHKLFIIKITRPSDAHYGFTHINSILKINNKYLKGIGCMENTQKDIVDSARGAGYWLKEAYKAKNAESKLNGISYRLLNALKTNNRGTFMDTLLNCYLYAGKEVPMLIVESLKGTNENFKTIGYAFTSGMIEGSDRKTNNN